MITLIFEAHSSTEDNEDEIATGWNDVPLSALGEVQAKELGKRYKDADFDLIFCSDLQRSYQTAEIAFKNKFIIMHDARLRPCNYGDWNGDDKADMAKYHLGRIDKTYPNGESWRWAVKRVEDCLEEIKREYDGQRILIIGHRATQYGIEKVVNGRSVRESLLAGWSYKPGWEYELK